MEVTRHTVMSDKMGFHFFELPKLPEEISDRDELLLWLALFRAETEEELEQIKALEVPEMEQAINAYYKITASPEFRELERMRERARNDEMSALHHAKQEGKLERDHEIARNALGMGMPLSDIARLTGLSKQEIEELR